MATGHTPCGISIPQTFSSQPIDVELIRKFLPRAEALGFDSLWVSERMLSDYAILEPVTLLTYAAALTTRARLGSSVLLTVIRNPVQLAKSLASLDQLSRGRLTVGIGIGGARAREAVFGYPTERRARRFIEGLNVMKALWTEPQATIAGDYWRFENIAMEPKPFQKPHPPVWFGASDPIALRRAVRHGNGWMGAGSMSSADFAIQYEHIRRFLDEEKRDPASFMISKRVYVAVDPDRARAERQLREWFASRYNNPDNASRCAIWGNAAEIVDKLGAVIRSGARHLMLNPVHNELEQMEMFAADVVPHL